MKDNTMLLTADFETTTDLNDCRVWASCLFDIENEKVVHLSNNIDSTFDYLKTITKFINVTLYYHNLKFDGEFILYYLLDNGYVYDEDLKEKNSFRTLITDSGAFYQIQIKFKKGKNAFKVNILDSLKILPLPVSKIAKAFGLPVLKGEIDYTAFRPVNHEITKEEKEYIINDCKIVALALKQMFSQGLDRMTIASNAINNYKQLIKTTKFNALFPQIDIKADEFIRKSYKGGYTYVNPKYQYKDINKVGRVYDVNSLYPSVMYDRLLPYDEPIYYEGDYPNNPNYPLYIQHIKCKFKLKKGFPPIIQLKGNSRFKDTEYLENNGVERVDLYLTNIDLEMVKKHYTLTRDDYIEGYMFRGKQYMFKDYIDYWTELKIKATKEGNSGLRQIAKLMLNSLYGKFATNPKADIKIPILEGETTKLILSEGKERKLVYTAMASFITAYAREVTITAIANSYNRFLYADTDSIHCLGDEPLDIPTDDTKLGYWKHESTFTKARYLRAKTYLEVINGELDVKCAGMPKNLKKEVTWENFKVGLTLNGKLTPKRCKGGVVLLPTTFQIK